MTISTDILAFINDDELIKMLEDNKALKSFVDMEIDRMKDSGIIKSCGGCKRGCSHGCCGNGKPVDASYLTAALVSIFNYYIPDAIKDSIHMSCSVNVEEK